MQNSRKLEKHPSVQAAKYVRQINHELFSQIELMGFGYAKLYDDNSRALLWDNELGLTDTVLLDFMRATKQSHHFQIGRYYYHSDFLHDQSMGHQIKNKVSQRVIYEREKYGVGEKLSIICKNQNHLESFTFALTPSISQPKNHFLNHLTLLENHVKEFKEKARDLIEKADNDRIIQPWQPLSANNGENSAGILSNLTKCESICYYLCMGNTAAQIADRVYLSKRTVEAYLAQLKEAHNCRNMAHLAAQFAVRYAYLFDQD